MEEPAIEVNESENRFEVNVDGQVAYLKFEWVRDRIALIHTEVPQALAGRGLATRLARAGLDFARREGLAVVPVCPVVAAYIRRHKEYLELVPGRFRSYVSKK